LQRPASGRLILSRSNKSIFGQITQNPSSLFRKNISVFPKYKSGYMICIVFQTEGALPTSGRDAVEEAVRETGAAKLNLFHESYCAV
jgi:hypothetical protein